MRPILMMVFLMATSGLWGLQQPAGHSYYDRDIMRIALHQILELGRRKERG